MAYTVAQVMRRALFRIHVLQAGETPNATDAALALDAYNGMMFGFEAAGLTLHDADDVAYTVAVQAQADDIPLADKHYEGLAAILASRMPDDFGAQISPVLARDIQDAWARMYGDFLEVGTMTLDRSLTRLPSQTDEWQA